MGPRPGEAAGALAEPGGAWRGQEQGVAASEQGTGLQRMVSRGSQMRANDQRRSACLPHCELEKAARARGIQKPLMGGKDGA